MAAANGLKLVFGSSPFLSGGTVEEAASWLNILEGVGINTIDTAKIYGPAEELLGKAGASKRFIIDTKQPGALDGDTPSTRDYVIACAEESLLKLQADSVDVYYLHAPDHRVPWKETLSGLDELYRRGAFKRLGISNFRGKDVEEIVSVAKENNFVVPSVYQGNYSAVARRIEDEVFPVLRKHNIAFYAYSPIAGGFLARSKAQLTDPEGRFGKGDVLAQIYNQLYNRPNFVAALDVWEQIAQAEGVSRAGLAYRWIVYHSKLQGDLGDAVIIGSTKEQQLRETLEAIKKGPLSDASAQRVGEIWDSIKADALLDNTEAAVRL